MIAYEWIAESVDEFGDIQESAAADTFAQVMATAAADGCTKDIALVRNKLNDIDRESLEDRAWAYFSREIDGFLPDAFDDGNKVPRRFRGEVAKYFQQSAVSR